jgi:hypothetical protein
MIVTREEAQDMSQAHDVGKASDMASRVLMRRRRDA